MKTPSSRVFLTAIRKRRRVELSKLGVEPRGPNDLSYQMNLEQPAPRNLHWLVKGKELTRNQLVEFLCEEMCEGKSLVELCHIPGMPTLRQVMGWARREPVFREALEEADLVRGLVLAEQAVSRGISATNDTAKADKVAVEALKWMSGKLNTRFADRQVIEHKHELEELDRSALQARFIAAVEANPELISKLDPAFRKKVLDMVPDTSGVYELLKETEGMEEAL